MSALRIPKLSEVGRSLEGVFRLIEGDEKGLGLFDTSANGFLRSFLAYAWCWPAQAFLWTGAWRTPEGVARPDSVFGMIGYFFTGGMFDLLAWIVPALVIYPVSRVFGFRAHYMRTIVATNWFGVVATYVAFLPATIGYLAPVPEGFAAMLSLASYGFVIWLHFRIARVALGGEGLLAMLVTLIALMSSILVTATAFRVLGI